ncbi:hypothetical protein [Faecalibaculum rodentium]|jgi:hypothetical protein|uniref:PTS EIIA type-1 domain-containing protein n=1 Tax=Faecalibaculum rodentium TaxID=1702221 RepID=A0A140DT89_9FIRM|nr:hypothetical protein [Faecalibaculum rodentium]AMK53866.1 hypothetical protein AALO17_07320 [Faecalibaculum rodentium]
MADFFKNLEKHIEDGWDDIKNAVKDSAADLKEGAQALDGRVDATPVMKAEEAEAAGIVEGMLKGSTLCSPCASTVATIARTPGHTGLTLANSEGVIVALPDNLQDQIQVLVTEGQPVSRGTPLMQFTQEALNSCTIDLVLPELMQGPDGEPERIIRVFGPVKPE